MTILIVEDNKNTNETLLKYLDKISSGRLTVYTAGTLKEGVELGNEKRPAVVILDLLLPDSPTWQETVAHIKDFKDPVIVVTGCSVAENDYEIFMACMRAGARRVFEKPVMHKIWAWLGENPEESFAARLLGTAGTIHLEQVYGTTT